MFIKLWVLISPSSLVTYFTYLYPVLLAGNVQGCEPVQGAAVRVRLAVEQQLGDARVATVRGHVERGQIVDSDLVYGSLVVK